MLTMAPNIYLVIGKQWTSLVLTIASNTYLVGAKKSKLLQRPQHVFSWIQSVEILTMAQLLISLIQVVEIFTVTSTHIHLEPRSGNCCNGPNTNLGKGAISEPL